MDKTKRNILVIYTVLALAAVLVIAFFCKDALSVVNRSRNITGYDYITEMDHSQISDESYPLGVADSFTFTLDGEADYDCVLMVYSVHENIEIYIDGELLYSRGNSSGNHIMDTPGDAWNTIPLYETDYGKNVEIRMIPVYKTHIGNVPEVYVGDQLGIINAVMGNQALPLLTALILIVLGIVYIVIVVVEYRKYENRNGMIMLGMLSILAGSWKLTDMSVLHWYVDSPLALTYLALSFIMFLVVPFMLYEISLFQSDFKRIIYGMCFLSLAAIALSLVLQVLQIADFRQTLWVHHIMMGLAVILSVGLAVYDIKKHGWTSKLIVSTIAFGFCILGVGRDFITFYFKGGKSLHSVGIVGFLIYVGILGIMSIRDARNWIELGHEAEDFKDMALHDAMTSTFNRNAFAKDTSSSTFSPQGKTVVMLDLNDLKKCNDTLGHEAGDSYIRTAASIIKATFGKYGNVYRLGGDEFCVILSDVSDARCYETKMDMLDHIEVCNETKACPVLIQIACGYERYEEDRDYDISDTLRHADHRMYEHKLKLKGKNN